MRGLQGVFEHAIGVGADIQYTQSIVVSEEVFRGLLTTVFVSVDPYDAVDPAKCTALPA